MRALARYLSQQSDLLIVGVVVGILVILFTPIPPPLLDLLIIVNISFAMLILLLTFHVEKPLQFSTFPSLLLIATLFRLSLNIAATRLILSDANAGKVIAAIGAHVVAGNYVIGIIVFTVLIVVQYVVITNGAQRVAEVAARFTLDSMPGKQMSIDADLNVGLIDETEAKRRRRELERESNFYGAMDGASKFVKGDAVAGILITFINIIGGLAIGMVQKGMAWGEALQTYALLTIGDGIVTQIPALVISTGTGIIVTRAASDEFLSKEVVRQVTAYPKVLVFIGAGLFAFLLLPGIPAFPVLIVLGFVGALAFYLLKTRRQAEQEDEEAKEADGGDSIYDMLVVEQIEVRLGRGLQALGADGTLLADKIGGLRKQYAQESGLVIPKVRIKDNLRIGVNDYEILINGVVSGKGEALQDKLLAIGENKQGALEGTPTREPSYGLPAIWIAPEKRKEARSLGFTVVEPLTVILTHLGDVIRKNAAALLSRAETERLLEQVRARQRGLVEELVPNVLSTTEVQKVLQELLREKVSIRNMELILETLVDAARKSKDASALAEYARQVLAPVICQSLVNDKGELYVLTLDPAIERVLGTGLKEQSGFAVEPGLADRLLKRLADGVEKMMNENLMPVLLCTPELRRHLHRFTERVLPHLSVVALTEVSENVKLKSFGVVSA